MTYDFIIVGSGAGGSACAYHLAQSGKRVLLLERGMALPRDGSTLDVDRVFRQGAFLADEPWQDGSGKLLVPQERFNVGGKTKWYGAALLRFGPHEFEADTAHGCLPWPFPYEELEPWYDEAEQLLGVRSFSAEPDLQRIVAGLRRLDAGWHRHALPMALAPDILAHPHEARHFDGFASPRSLKADAENALLDRVRHNPYLVVAAGKPVVALTPAPGNPARVAGVECEDGSRHQADAVILAAGALHSPRLLQGYLESNELAGRVAGYGQVGRNYKYHALTALLALSFGRKTDLLRKTTLLTHETLPHSSVQPLGWFDGEILSTELPGFVPRWMADIVGARVYGFFLQTEDGSHPDNRVLARAPGSARPLIDYRPERIPAAFAEHRRLRGLLRRQLLALGHAALVKTIPVAGSAHACGTLVTGRDPATSVVDPTGRVHGMDNLYVADGSVLPRSARVNPALTIYAWGLRVASLLTHRSAASATRPVADAAPGRSTPAPQPVA